MRKLTLDGIELLAAITQAGSFSVCVRRTHVDAQ